RIQDARLLAKVLADALLLGEGISHRVVTSGLATPRAGPANFNARRPRQKTAPSPPAAAPHGAARTERGAAHEVLLDLHLRAGFFELLLHCVGIGLVHGFLDRGGSTLDQVLRLFQSQ